MPFNSCPIEPANIRHIKKDQESGDVLESMANATLANAIRQLSSLSAHATRLMNELGAESARITTRAELLSKRIERIAERCNGLDYLNDPVPVYLSDLKESEPFLSEKKLNLNVLNKANMPESLRLLYERADPAPSLHILTPYRDDLRDCAKTYSDPDFFFNEWCSELLRSGESKDLVKQLRRERRKGQKRQQDEINHSLKAQVDRVDEISSIMAEATLNQEQIDQIEDTSSGYINYSMDDSFTETDTSDQTVLPVSVDLPVLSSTPSPPLPPMPIQDESEQQEQQDQIVSQVSEAPRSFLDDIKSRKFVLKSNVKLETLDP